MVHFKVLVSWDHGRALIRGVHMEDGKGRVQLLLNDDVGGAGLGDVQGQVGKQGLQIRCIRGNGHIGRIRVAGPVVQGAFIQAAGTQQPDAVDDDPRRLGRRRNGGRRGAGGGFAVGE